MKNLFLDTNILVDLIADRQPFSKYAVKIFEKAESQKVKLFTSSHSIVTTYYVLKKYHDEKKLRNILLNLIDFIHISGIDKDIIIRSLNSKHKDFEDAVQMNAAYSINKIDFIVTRNLKDFKLSEIPVLPPDVVIEFI